MTLHAGNPPAPPPTSLVGRVLSDRYRVEALLGEGGMGAVYLAEHLLMHKRLAIKVLHQEMTRMPEIVARFEREAMAAAHIEHPNVAAATDFGKLEDGSFFLVLEYIEGTSLRDVIAKGPLPVARALHITYQIASALARAHGLGIVHRDLKPENVMLVERDGDHDFVKVLDFGIAKVPVGGFADGAGTGSGPALTQLGMVYGTPEYMAPEQALGQSVDLRADLYALGVMLFEMITGLRPFDSDSKVALLGMKVTHDAPTLASKNADVKVPSSVEALTMRLLDKEAERRPEDAREVLDAIERTQLGAADTIPPGGSAAASLAALPTARLLLRRSRASISDAQNATPGLRARLVALAARGLALGQRLRDKTPAALHTVPSSVLAAGASIAVMLVLVGTVAVLRRGGSVRVPSADGGLIDRPQPHLIEKLMGPVVATPAALSAAAQSGVPALEELATKYTQDPAVLSLLVKAHASSKHYLAAMEAVGRLAALGAKAVDDDDVHDAVVAAAQGPPDAADASFALMEGALGAKGSDWIYELSMARTLSPRLLARARASLAKADVKAHATPALQIAMDLRAAKTCEAKKAVLPRVKELGDVRALALLRPLMDSRGCGFLGLGDCWTCMRRDGSLVTAIGVLEDRKDR